MQIMHIKKFLTNVLLLALLPIVPVMSADSEKPEDTSHLPIDHIKLFAEVYSEIKNQYVEPVDDDILFEAAIDGMISQLDKYSLLMDSEAFENIKELSEGRFFGIGIEILPQKNYILVVTPIDGSPAIEAGIQAGDKITAIDGEPVESIGVKTAVDKLKGRNGSKVRLRLDRNGDIRNVNVTRGRVKTETAQGRWLEEGFYYVRLSMFQDTSDQEIRRLIEQAKSEQPIKGLIFDLRNNPGGTLYAATEVSDLFLSEGKIVSIRERGVTDQDEYFANPDDVIEQAPIVMMINKGSASASEIVAGALRDNQRALIVGSTSFGKGSVQHVHQISQNYAIKLTVAKYYTPSGVSIHDTGIVPDIIISPNQSEDEQLSNQELVERRLAQKELTEIDSETRQALRILKQQINNESIQ